MGLRFGPFLVQTPHTRVLARAQPDIAEDIIVCRLLWLSCSVLINFWQLNELVKDGTDNLSKTKTNQRTVEGKWPIRGHYQNQIWPPAAAVNAAPQAERRLAPPIDQKTKLSFSSDLHQESYNSFVFWANWKIPVPKIISCSRPITSSSQNTRVTCRVSTNVC